MLDIGNRGNDPRMEAKKKNTNKLVANYSFSCKLAKISEHHMTKNSQGRIRDLIRGPKYAIISTNMPQNLGRT
jgi:hypothetical protein